MSNQHISTQTTPSLGYAKEPPTVAESSKDLSPSTVPPTTEVATSTSPQVVPVTAEAVVTASPGPAPETSLVGRPPTGDTASTLPLPLAPTDGQHPSSTLASNRDSDALLPLSLSFKNIRFSVMVKEKRKMVEKVILKGVDGVFQAGSLTVILGSTGAGKTSLLNILSGTGTTGTVKGEIRLNHQVVTGNEVKKLSGFVFQDDVVMPTSTVEEAVTLSAHLRLPKNIDPSMRENRINRLIKALQLTNCRRTPFGNEVTRGLSGGEKKRTCIAMELITNPPILFLDEPTSGLDSFTAFKVMFLLKNLAKEGRTIVTTLHQPSSEIFHMIDHLIFMGQGEVMYQGKAENVVNYFAKLGYICPIYTNPSDFLFMNVTNDITLGLPTTKGHVGGDKATEAQSDASQGEKVVTQPSNTPFVDPVPKLIASWKSSPDSQDVLRLIDINIREQGNSVPPPVKTDWILQFQILMARAFKNAVRSKFLFAARAFQIIFIGFIVSVLFWDVNNKNFNSQIQNRSGSLYFIAVQQLMGPISGMLSVFGKEKLVFLREYNNNYYGLSPYFFSKVLVELPFQILMPCLLVIITYWSVGFQNTAEKFFIQLFTSIVLTNCGASIGMAFGSAFSDIQVALAIFPIVMIPLMIFGGLMVSLDTLPNWLTWLQYITPSKYGYAAFARNEFEGLTICVSASVDSNVAGMIATYNQMANAPHPNTSHALARPAFPPPGVTLYSDEACFSNITDQIFTRVGLSSSLPLWENVYILIGMYFICLGIAFFMLWRNVGRKERVKYE